MQLPKIDADGNEEPEAPRETKRPTAAMPLRSKRDLSAGAPAVSVVPDLPPEPDDVDDVEVEVTAEASGDAETYSTPSALDDPAVVVEEPVEESVQAGANAVEPEQAVQDEVVEDEVAAVAASRARDRPCGAGAGARSRSG